MIHMVDNKKSAETIIKSDVYKNILDEILKGKGEIIKKNLQL